MRGGEHERVGALRMVLSELQKAAKEGRDDELVVLRRERKRRLEAAGTFRDAGREELAAPRSSEAELIAAYLPAELSEEELHDRRAGRPRQRRQPAEGHGGGHEARDGRRRRSRGRQGVSGLVRAALQG